PSFSREFKGRAMPYLFELDNEALQRKTAIRYETPSDQPHVMRDLAVVVSEQVTAGQLNESLERMDCKQLQSVRLFDLFRADELGEGRKSLALSLNFQDISSTLDDETVDDLVATVVQELNEQFDAKIRGESSND